MVASQTGQAAAPDDAGALGIICGGGSLPLAVADAASRHGRRVVMFALRGFAAPEVERYPCHWIMLGALGRFFRLLRQESCRDLVFIGALTRPTFGRFRLGFRLDLATIRRLPRIARAFRGGDDHLLAGITRLIEDEGFRVLGAHEVAPEILLAEGALGSRRPAEADRVDIARGLELLAATGPFDIGQATVVAGRHVLAIEAIEGTDRMLDRIVTLRQDGRIRVASGTGVLVKAPKPQQDRRFDLPTIGPETVEAVARAGLAGVAAVAGAAIVAEPQRVAQLAEARGVFVVGVAPAGAGA
jgi:UDP-2,3-diacylglucosamine hydrolase